MQEPQGKHESLKCTNGNCQRLQTEESGEFCDECWEELYGEEEEIKS